MSYPIISLLALFIGLASAGSPLDPVFVLPHRGCYFTNWSQYRPGDGKYKAANVDASLCTYINIAFGSIVGNMVAPLEWNDDVTFAALVDIKRAFPSLKLLLSVGGWTLSSQLSTMASSSVTRKIFVESAASRLREWGMDGLDIDWEFPLTADKDLYSAFLMELREAFEKEAVATNRTRLALTAAVHLISDGGFDGPVINNALDVANVMTYDLDGAWNPSQTGHVAPLFVGSHGTPSAWNVQAVMQAWVDAGVSKSKLAVGLPLYGRGWILSTPAEHGLGAPANGGLPAGPYTREAGSWSFYEICLKLKTEGTSVFDDTIQASYAYSNTWWVGYDDVRTITGKTKWAQSQGFGGVFVWDLSQDDFANMCGLGVSPLMNAIRTAQGGAPPVPMPTAPPTPSTANPWWPIVQTSTQQASVPASSGSSNQEVSQTTESAVGVSQSTPSISDNIVSGTCNEAFCAQSGPGVVAMGGCLSEFCSCGAANLAWTISCGNSLIFDAGIKACNFGSSVAGCKV